MVIVLDIQGFYGRDNEFLPKEIAYMNPYTEKSHVFLLKLPYKIDELNAKQKKSAYYCSSSHHGLSWSSGITNLSDIFKILEKLISFEKIYVKGQQKCDWIKQTFEQNKYKYELVNLEDSNEHKISCLQNLRRSKGHLYPECIFHSNVFTCAFQNVHLIASLIKVKPDFLYETDV